MGRGPRLGGKAETKSNQIYFPRQSPSGLFCFPATPHTHTHTCIFDLIMPLFVAVMKTGIPGGGGGLGAWGVHHSIKTGFLSFLHAPPTASPRLCIRIHVALWPHTIDPCFLIAPPGGKQYPSAVWLPPIKKWSKCVLSRKTGFYGYLFVCLFVLQGFVYYLVLFFFFFSKIQFYPLTPPQYSSISGQSNIVYLCVFIEMLVFI